MELIKEIKYAAWRLALQPKDDGPEGWGLKAYRETDPLIGYDGCRHFSGACNTGPISIVEKDAKSGDYTVVFAFKDSGVQIHVPMKRTENALFETLIDRLFSTKQKRKFFTPWV